MNDQEKRLCVISIVGIGGLGKTTLARKLYHNNAVINRFSTRIWVTVSQESTLMGLLVKMIEKVNVVVDREERKTLTENDWMHMLNQALKTRRFLIVLDDIWQEDVWVQIQGSFPNANNGSKVLITTRFHNVAKRADPRSTPYQLPLLNDDDSMKLFLKKVFSDQDVEANCSSELLDIGRPLMCKCGGLPLALVVLGGLLSMKEKTPAVWWRMLETMDWEAEGRECQEILALSYEVLPYHMKSCFLYLGVYPEDYNISGSVLIKQWVAEGFIPQDSERKTMEDTGEAILEELIQRCLIHVNTRKNNGSVKKCGVHDLLLDFARFEAKKNGFLTVCSRGNDQATSPALSRRVAIHSIKDTMIHEIYTMHGLRTSILLCRYDDKIVSRMFRFQLLRVLDLIGSPTLEKLPKEIKLMIHLRYLRLRNTGVVNIPSSIENLRYLETINASVGAGVPATLWKIKTLRHVQVSFCRPPQKVELRILQTLMVASFGCYTTIKWSVPNLRKLKVLITKEQDRTMLAQLLSELCHLTSLCVTSSKCPIEINTKDLPFHHHLLSLTLHGVWPIGDTCEYPTYLAKLELCSSRLEHDPMPKLEKLQYLVSLKLYEYVYLGKTLVCSAGGFPRLERFVISTKISFPRKPFHRLEEWRLEKGAMPKLTFLELTSCKKLKMLPDLQHVMSLRELKLSDMSKVLMLSVRKDTGKDWYKIQHVPKLTFLSN